MKPRTTVPATLLRDLKVYAGNSLSGDIACQLLWLDPAVEADASPKSRAFHLAWVAYYLSKVGAKATDDATDCEDQSRVPARDAGWQLAALARDFGEVAGLQRRVARVIQALLLPRGVS